MREGYGGDTRNVKAIRTIAPKAKIRPPRQRPTNVNDHFVRKAKGQRIEKLLEKREDPILAPEVLQVLRALEVLEHTGSPEARLALEQFAKQTADDYYRQEARAAALRLGK